MEVSSVAFRQLLFPTLVLLVMVLALVGSVRAARRRIHPAKRRHSKARQEIERILGEQGGQRR
ncbi:hypothetical protein IIA16_01220 [bacterium]|nr:hypothetical protein [bacterium]